MRYLSSSIATAILLASQTFAQAPDCTVPEAVNALGTTAIYIGGQGPSDYPNAVGTACEVPPSDDVGYLEWVAPADGDYVITLNTMGFDFTMRVYVGSGCSAFCIGEPTFAGCSTGACFRQTLQGLSAGTAVVIQVRNRLTETIVQPFPLPPIRVVGDVGAAEVIIREADKQANDDCSRPMPIAGLGNIGAFDNSRASDSNFGGAIGGCVNGVPPAGMTTDVFFTWTAPHSGDFSIRTSFFGFSLAVYQGTDCDAICLDSDLFPSLWPQVDLVGVQAGDPFLIQIGDLVGDCRLSISSPGHANDMVCTSPEAHYQGGSVTLNESTLGSGVGAGLHLEAINGPSGEFGFLLGSFGSGSALPVFQGFLCLANPIGRYSATVANNMGLPELNSIGIFDDDGILLNLSGSSTTGTGFDLPSRLPTPLGPGSLLPGDTIYLQCWYRDKTVGGGPSANFSNVLGATLD
tara:strand:- start:346 stop:1731 length:1386 start_codon:yes stop_codon:yes gene_type:complete